MPRRRSKEQRVLENLRRTTQQFLEGRGYIPLTGDELAARLDIAPHYQQQFFELLGDMVNEGVLSLEMDRYSLGVKAANCLKGVLRAHHRGFGFVVPEDAVQNPADVFIPKHAMNGAVDGDIVEVQVTDTGHDKGPEGRIIKIVSRGRSRIAGVVTKARRDEVYVYAPLLGKERPVRVTGKGAESLILGDRVALKVQEWGDEDSETVGVLDHLIGNIKDPSCDIAAAIEEFQIHGEFPKAVLDEAQAFGGKIPQTEIRKREDFRDFETVTIDPQTAKDFDDAISLTKDEQGHYHLGVHIADASFYVRPGSSLDKEASLRCNSVYFPGTVVPMLPHELSSGLCSLKPNVNRLTVSVMMELDATGSLVKQRICRSVIKSQKRFAYEDAKLILDGKRASKHKALLERMVELCLLLKRKRQQRGSIEFALPELVVQVTDDGVATGVTTVEYDITHQMIEEFMLKANEVVARSLSERGLPVSYRIHEEPSEEDMRDFASLANVFGFTISAEPTIQELQNLFDEAIHSPFGEHLAIQYIRKMRMAYYSPNNIGHYGLRLEYYCHFTSPIRRYVDIVAHRLLFDTTIQLDAVKLISEKCSEQERIAARAEGSVKLLKKLRLLQSWKDEDPSRQYEAVVTEVKPFGISYSVSELHLDGFLHISRLTNDFFVFQEGNQILVGQDSGVVFRTGEVITLYCAEVDLIEQEASWHLAGAPEPKSGVSERPEKRERRERREKRPASKRREKGGKGRRRRR